ncbi:DCC1-like thiol-disulfide oxidoreductase family protein [Mesorhizobium sp. L-8-3]|uniref:DCC1-like thiol-disulfide oxidoreductase family protein n=1 Tax=Mesorhizobium sp. L-8-3 TaxID=2744522 RepID=UPI0019265D2E|nr:DCC1-like thiol-disulfide oxidoreductase family protein [Mesorhizobium sp. L-8-3]BCH24859.1 hypothetical protein MesoLjLb_46440 [Mesorhizobium sp. L-8-3]
MKTNYLLYDGDCPACSAYVAVAALRKLHPSFQVLDARHEPLLVAAMRSQGFDVNEGIILDIGGKIHFGADAVRMMARLGKDHGIARRTILVATGDASWSAWLYPRLKRGRRRLLELLGRPPIG